VQRVVQRHGGSVRAHSGPEGGATFFVRLPRNPAE
jgi:signal transduction histidine kinase